MGVAADPEKLAGGRAAFLEGSRSESGMWLAKVAMDRLSDRAPFKMSKFFVEPGGHTPLDCHEDRELWMVAAGAGELSYGGREVHALRAGDVFEMASQVSHTLRNTGSEELVVFSVWWDP